MSQTLEQRKESPSQTAGPYVHIGLTPNLVGIGGVFAEDLGSRALYRDGAEGERITIKGHVRDGTGAALTDALVEIWHADANGNYPTAPDQAGGCDPHFTGWGRSAGELSTGEFTFETIKPGRVPHPSGQLQAPHISFWIVARGISLGLQTRMYFADEKAANSEDPILSRIEHRHRVPTLIAEKREAAYHFDIRLQGEDETIFFDF